MIHIRIDLQNPFKVMGVVPQIFDLVATCTFRTIFSCSSKPILFGISIPIVVDWCLRFWGGFSGPDGPSPGLTFGLGFSITLSSNASDHWFGLGRSSVFSPDASGHSGWGDRAFFRQIPMGFGLRRSSIFASDSNGHLIGWDVRRFFRRIPLACQFFRQV